MILKQFGLSALSQSMLGHQMGPEPGLDRWVEQVYSKGANISRSSGHLEDSQETEDIKVGWG